jgi:hypothetical protein
MFYQSLPVLLRLAEPELTQLSATMEQAQWHW